MPVAAYLYELETGLPSLMCECFESFCALENVDIKIQSQGTSQIGR